jgi:glycosyltransferase involved in cell wall biosynthesis
MNCLATAVPASSARSETTRADTIRYVVWMPGADATSFGPARPGACHGGGHRTLHELAVAIAATGRQVEVRGEFDLAVLGHLAKAAGAAPELPTDHRRPGRGDVVLIPEGLSDPAVFAQVALSSARGVILLLAPPGLFGWPFEAGWSPESPLTVAINALARPEQFQAMASLGFELWTNTPEMARQVHASGVSCAFIGNGTPLAYPPPLPKRYDVVTIANNRWAELARAVLERLDPAIAHHDIPACSNDELLQALGQARILIHPMRTEGFSRLGLEARAMGAVPVVLDSNRFAVGLDEEGGGVAVSSLEQMASAVQSLLTDPQRLAALRQRGMRSARTQIAWDTYVARVDAALSSPEPEPPAARAAQAAIGKALSAREDALRETLVAQGAELEALRSERTRWIEERGALAAMLADERALICNMQRTRAWQWAGHYWRTRSSLRSSAARLRASINRYWPSP